MKYKISSNKEEFDTETSDLLGYAERTHAASEVLVFIDEEVKQPSYYRQVISRINSLTEHDTLVFRICSPGGDLGGLTNLLDAVHCTEANTVAHIVGDCHSAASILALNCGTIYVSNYANMLVHGVSFGSHGKSFDVQSQVKHIADYSEQIFRDTYEHFLSEKEIQEVLQGREMWLQADEITSRLENRQKKLEQQHKKLEQQHRKLEQQHKKQTKTQKTEKSKENTDTDVMV